MSVEGRVGAIDITRIFDTALLGYTAQSWFPKFDREALAPHEHRLRPHHYDPESGRIPMPVSSWLFRVNGAVVLIDTCIGADKDRPRFPEMHKLDTRYLERSAQAGVRPEQAGVRPEDVDYIPCSHLHVDHVGGGRPGCGRRADTPARPVPHRL